MKVGDYARHKIRHDAFDGILVKVTSIVVDGETAEAYLLENQKLIGPVRPVYTPTPTIGQTRDVDIEELIIVSPLELLALASDQNFEFDLPNQ